MKISDVIKILKDTLEEHGDVECFSYDGECYHEGLDIIDGRALILTKEGVEDLTSYTPLIPGDTLCVDHYYFAGEVEERHYSRAENVILFNTDLLG